MIEPLIREATAADLPFVFNSWLKSHRDVFYSDEDNANPELTFKKHRWLNHDSTKFMRKECYFSSYKGHVQRLVDKSTVLIACAPDRPSDIYSYLVFEKIGKVPVVHYGYTKHTYRKFGFFKRLAGVAQPQLLSEPVVVTCYSSMVRELKEKWKLVFDPYIMEQK